MTLEYGIFNSTGKLYIGMTKSGIRADVNTMDFRSEREREKAYNKQIKLFDYVNSLIPEEIDDVISERELEEYNKIQKNKKLWKTVGFTALSAAIVIGGIIISKKVNKASLNKVSKNDDISTNILQNTSLADSPNGTYIIPKEFPKPNFKALNVFDEYPEGKNYPFYDPDNARFTKQARAKKLERLLPDENQEFIYISNFDEPYGTIAGTSTLDKILYTDRMSQCAALAVVDKKRNTQSLIHVFPGYSIDDNKQIIDHIVHPDKAGDIELSIVPGYSSATKCTVQFLLDTLAELAPDKPVKLYNFPRRKFSVLNRGVVLKGGKLYCCDAREIKNRIINPKNHITYRIV